MISLDEAWGLLEQHTRELPPLARQRLALWSARGRVLAEEVISPVDLPAADYSAMDGYALCAADWTGEGCTLPLAGQSRTGHPTQALARGTCARIFTGAHLPDGADAVVMQENTRATGDRVSFLKRPQLGEHIRRRGEDLQRGAQVLRPGTRLFPHQLGLLASVERTEVMVFRKPRVRIVCTGDELRPFGARWAEGQLSESNGIVLAGLCAEAGAEVAVTPIARDDMQDLERMIDEAMTDADAVLTVGGVSVGDHDLVRPALERLGGEVIFHKVAIKPGKPVLFARRGATFVLGLPGNPSSAQAVFSLLGAPLVRQLGGDVRSRPLPRTAVLTHEHIQKPGRRAFYRGHVKGDQVTILSNQASGATTSMGWANALVEMASDITRYEAGQRVPVWMLLDW